MYNSQPIAAFKKEKPSEKMSLYSQCPLIQLWINNFFFLSLFSRGKEDFPLFHVFKGSCSSWVTCDTKVIPEPFCCYCRHRRRRRWKRKEERKKERDSAGEGGKTFLPLELLKPTLSLRAPKIPRGTKPANQGGRETVTSFSSHCFLHLASQKHRLATGRKSSSCDWLLLLYFKPFYSLPEMFDICHAVAPTPPALSCHFL